MVLIKNCKSLLDNVNSWYPSPAYYYYGEYSKKLKALFPISIIKTSSHQMNRAYEGHASRSKATSSLKRRIGWLNLLLFFWLRGENEIVSTSYEIMMMRHVIKMGNGSPNMSFDAMLLYSNIEAEKNCFTRLNDAFLHHLPICWRVLCKGTEEDEKKDFQNLLLSILMGKKLYRPSRGSNPGPLG